MSRKTKTEGLHLRNLHRDGYDFTALLVSSPELSKFVTETAYGSESIDFGDPAAVKMLNKALLKHHYGIQQWDIPEGFLCPPVPGRVDYIHYVCDLLGFSVSEKTSKIRMLDVGTGANGIYALLAAQVYGWRCTGSDIDPSSLENVAKILENNVGLRNLIDLRLQDDNRFIFQGVIQEGEYYDVCVCNPPFHASLEEALKGNQKKVTNLKKNREKKMGRPASEDSQPKEVLNFGGQKAELWCKGGEIRFLRKMLKESKKFATQCQWFTTLVSKSENVKPCLTILKKLGANEVKEIPMTQGNKLTRVVAWRF